MFKGQAGRAPGHFLTPGAMLGTKELLKGCCWQARSSEQCRLGVTCSAAASRVEKKGLSYTSLGALWLRRTKGSGAVPEHPQRFLLDAFHFFPTMTSHKAADQLRWPSQCRALPGSRPLSSPLTLRADHQAGTRQGLGEKRAGNRRPP